MGAGTIKNTTLKYKASFVVTQIVTQKYIYRKLMASTQFKDNDLARESNYDHGFKIKPLTDMKNVVFQ
jgi:hypothetical protein